MKSILIVLLMITATSLVGCVYPAYHNHDNDVYENRHDRGEEHHRDDRKDGDHRDDRGDQGRDR